MAAAQTLFDAVSRGDVEAVNDLLLHGADPNATMLVHTPTTAVSGNDNNTDSSSSSTTNGQTTEDRVSTTPLGIAVGRFDVAVGRALIVVGANMDAVVDRSSTAALVYMIATGGVLPDGTDEGSLPHVYHYEGHAANVTDAAGKSALLHASLRSDAKLAAALLSGGASPFTTDPRNGLTPLLRAVKVRDMELIEVLLAGDADANYIARSGQDSPLTHAVKSGDIELVRLIAPYAGDKSDLVVAVSKHRYSIDTKIEGFSALAFAERAARADMVRELLAAGADVFDRVTLYAQSVIQIAGAHGNNECVIALLHAAKEKDPDRAAAEGEAALIAAVESRHVDTVTLLLEWGVTPSTRDTNGVSKAVTVGAQMGATACVAAVLDAGAEVNASVAGRSSPLIIAAKKLDVGMVELLLAAGADVMATDSEEGTAMTSMLRAFSSPDYATAATIVSIVHILLAAGAPLDVGGGDSLWPVGGNAPLHAAVYGDCPHAARYLVVLGAELEVFDADGDAPFNYVSEIEWMGEVLAEGAVGQCGGLW